MLTSLHSEFLRYRRLAELALERIDDEGLHARLDEDGNSIAVLVQHLAGNLRSRFTDFLDSDGEKPWRERDGEFDEAGRARAELLERWAAGWSALEQTLAELGRDDLEREVRIRGVALSVEAALLRSLAHVAYHVGQLVLLARHARLEGGGEWDSLSVPRGGSAAYARAPQRERSPDGG